MPFFSFILNDYPFKTFDSIKNVKYAELIKITKALIKPQTYDSLIAELGLSQ